MLLWAETNPTFKVGGRSEHCYRMATFYAYCLLGQVPSKQYQTRKLPPGIGRSSSQPPTAPSPSLDANEANPLSDIVNMPSACKSSGGKKKKKKTAEERRRAAEERKQKEFDELVGAAQRMHESSARSMDSIACMEEVKEYFRAKRRREEDLELADMLQSSIAVANSNPVKKFKPDLAKQALDDIEVVYRKQKENLRLH